MTHGWNDDKSSFLGDARDAFQTHTTHNFIAVDWSVGAKLADYVQAASNTQSAGRAIAYMFNELKNNGFRANQFECSGHSLGSHVCTNKRLTVSD